MPDSANHLLDRWLTHLANVEVNENTIFVGHSSYLSYKYDEKDSPNETYLEESITTDSTLHNGL